MDIKVFPALIVGVVVALVLAGATLPIWADTLATEDTFVNKGYYDMSYTESDNVTATWDHTKPHQITVNNEVVELPESPENAVTIICGDGWLIRYTGTAVQLYLNATSNRSASVTDETDATFTASEGTATFTTTAETNNTATVTYTAMYFVSSTGDYVMKKPNESAYVLGDSVIYGQGRSYLNNVSASVMLRVTGTVDDGVTVTNLYQNTNPLTFSDVTINKVAVTGYNDLYKVDTLTFTATNSDSTATDNVTYSYFIVPVEVTAERTVNMSGPLGVLVGVLPLLIVAGLVTGAVAWFISRKG